MIVLVRLPTLLRPAAGGQSQVTIDADTIGGVIDELIKEYPDMAPQLRADDGSLHKFVNLYLDDDDVRYLQQEDTPTREGATVSILPAVAGG